MAQCLVSLILMANLISLSSAQLPQPSRKVTADLCAEVFELKAVEVPVNFFNSGWHSLLTLQAACPVIEHTLHKLDTVARFVHSIVQCWLNFWKQAQQTTGREVNAAMIGQLDAKWH